MGLDRKVVLPAATCAGWKVLAGFLQTHQFPVKPIMIDGELAFPDEEPPDSWRELRLGTPLGMVTVRREDDGIRVITWGNADKPLLQAWNAVTWTLAAAFDGMIRDDKGSRSAAAFASQEDLPEGIVLD